MNNISSVSRFFRILFQIIFVGIPIVSILSWVTLNFDGSSFLIGAGPMENAIGFGLNPIPDNYLEMLKQANFDHLPFSSLQKLEGFSLSLIPMAVKLFMLYFLIKLFKLYEQGDIFSIKNVRYIRNVGYLLLIGQFVNLLYEVLLGMLLSWQHGNGSGMFGISINDDNFSAILTGLMVILISWIMGEGCKLREEQQLTI